MQHDQFEPLRDEWRADVTEVVKILHAVATKWQGRVDLVRSLTKEQQAEMTKISDDLDEALEDWR